jgi:hypothetical protein
MLVLYFFLVLPVIVEFFEKASRFSQEQAGSLLKSVLISGYTILAGSTFFPVNVFPVLFVITVTVIILRFEWRSMEVSMKMVAVFIIIFAFFLMISGTGAKFKSSILPHILFLIFIIGMLYKGREQWSKTLFSSVFMIYSVSGIFNVAFIKDTAKIPYNLPIFEVLNNYEEEWKGDEVVICSDNMSFHYHLNEKGINLSDCNDLENEKRQKILFIETYECFQNSSCRSEKIRSNESYKCLVDNVFGKDSSSNLKSLLQGAVLPDYYVKITKCKKK